jgi:integrase
MSKPSENNVLRFPSALAFPRGNLEDPGAMKPFLGISSRKPAAVVFTNAKEAREVRCPEGKKHWEAWHKTDSYLGVRIAAPRKRDGKILQVWIARYKDGDKHTKKVLGRITHMDYDEAHYQALRCKRIGANRSDDVIVETLLEAYDSYILVREKKLSESAKDDYKKAIAIVRDWHHRRLDTFTPKEISDRFTKIKLKIQKTAKAKAVGWDGNATAISVMRLLRSIFNDAIANHVFKHNPVSGLVRSGALKRTPRRAKPLEFAKLPEFWRWLHHGQCQPVVRDYILIALFTGFRLSVLNDLKWENYSSRMKTYKLFPETRGNKSKALVPMPLPSLVVEIFERRFKDRDPDAVYVLPSLRYKGQAVRSIRGSLAALSKEIKVKINVHDLRRLSATICLRATNNFLVMKRLLTHNLSAAAEREATSSGYPSTEYNELLGAMEAMVKYVFDAVGERYATRDLAPMKRLGKD